MILLQEMIQILENCPDNSTWHHSQATARNEHGSYQRCCRIVEQQGQDVGNDDSVGVKLVGPCQRRLDFQRSNNIQLHAACRSILPTISFDVEARETCRARTCSSSPHCRTGHPVLQQHHLTKLPMKINNSGFLVDLKVEVVISLRSVRIRSIMLDDK